MFFALLAGFGVACLTHNWLGESLRAALVPFSPELYHPAWWLGFSVYLIVPACIWKGLQRGLIGAMASFWSSALGRWLIGRIAGTIILASLLKVAWHACTEAAYLLTLLWVYLLGFANIQVLVWIDKWGVYIGTVYLAWKCRRPVKILLGRASRPVRRLYRSLGYGRGGSSGFAGIFEEWANPWKPGMILLGASMYDRKWLVGVKDDRMMMTVSSAGGGKGRCAILPNLLSYPGEGSILCVDPKGQNAAVSAERRRKLGQTVHIVDPMGSLKSHGFTAARFNPLAGIDPESADYIEQVDLVVDALVIAGDDKNRFWDDAARTLIAGLIDYVVRSQQGMPVVVPFKVVETDAAA